MSEYTQAMSPKKTGARASTPVKGRGKKKTEEIEETAEEESQVTETTKGSKSEDVVKKIPEEAPEAPKKDIETSTATVKAEEAVKNLDNLCQILNTKQCVGVVYVLAVAFLYHRWNPDMMGAFGISALMACITLYSMYKDEYLQQTALMLVVLGVAGGSGGFVTPNKKPNSIEAMQKQANTLIGQYAKCRVYKKAGEMCFSLKLKDPQSDLAPQYKKLYGKPFEPRTEEDWDQYNQFAGCEIKRKAQADSV